MHGLFERDGPDLRGIQRDHCAELLFSGRTHGRGSEAEGNQAVIGCGRATTLKVAEHESSRFAACNVGDFTGDTLADSAQTGVAARASSLEEHGSAAPGSRTFRYDDDREVATLLVALLDLLADAREI